MRICVSCASGTEAVLKRELYKLGYGDLPAINGRVYFEGDYQDVAKCNLLLRTANRVYIELASFKAQNFDELFDGVYAIEWEKWLETNTVLSSATPISHIRFLTAIFSAKLMCPT